MTVRQREFTHEIVWDNPATDERILVIQDDGVVLLRGVPLASPIEPYHVAPRETVPAHIAQIPEPGPAPEELEVVPEPRSEPEPIKPPARSRPSRAARR